MKIKVTAPLFLIVGVFMLAIHCGKSNVAETTENIIPVKLAPVQTLNIALPIHGSGMLFSKQQIRLSFKTGGLVEKLHAQEGENVRKGDVLAELYLAEIEAQVSQAESALAKAKRDVDRVSALYADSVATLEQKQNVETQLSVAKANVRIATFNLEHSTIKAPASGKILKRFAEENEMVGPGTPVFYFGSGNQEWIIRMGVADRDIIRLCIGDSAVIKFDAYPNAVFTGGVSEIAQAADFQNGTFEVEIQLEKQNKKLAAGFVGQISIFPQTQKQAIVIPINAIVEAHDELATVYTVENKKAVKIPVSIGAMTQDNIIITNGLEGIDSVISDGVEYLKAGDTVSVQQVH